MCVTGDLERAGVNKHESLITSDRRQHAVVLEPVNLRCRLSVDDTEQRRHAT